MQGLNLLDENSEKKKFPKKNAYKLNDLCR